MGFYSINSTLSNTRCTRDKSFILKSSFLILSVFFFWCTSCAQPEQDWTIKNKAEFDALSSSPLYEKYGQVSSVKIIYDNQTKKLHFIPSNEFDYHYEYCVQRLGYAYELPKFNIDAYSGEKDRRFLIANINYYQALDVFALELGPSDVMNPEHLHQLYSAVKCSTYFGKKLRLMLNTMHVNEISVHLTDLPFLTPNEIYQGQTYQPISKKKGDGRLVVITNWEEQHKSIRPFDIIVVNEIPEVFPLVAGVIVTEFQTPLSHVSLLGQNRGIPICAYSRAFETKHLMSLDGLTVSFSVQQDTFLINRKEMDLSALWKPGKEIRLKQDFSVDTLIPASYLREKHAIIVGNKAANFGELVQMSKNVGFKIPENAFAIPFHFYKEHTTHANVQQLIQLIDEKENMLRSREEVEIELEKIRSLIQSTSISDELMNAVKKMIARNATYSRMRFRSSTNAEDSEEFSGAGLYTSKTGDMNDPSKPIDVAIKKVWASLWTYEAFMEREAVNMRHQDVAMGILVHRSFPEEEVNGVAITTNIYRKNYLGFVVNAQIGNENVVNPSKGVQCDQFICYPDESVSEFGKEEGGIDIISYSSLNNGKLVMSKEEIRKLANVLELIKRKYVSKHYLKTSYFDFGLDIEFKLDSETRELYVKQMRVYNR